MNEKKMLVLDELEINRNVLKNVFEKQFEMIEAESEKQAREILINGQEVDIIIMELDDSVTDDGTFLRFVKSDSRFCNIPVIATSEFASAKDEAIALELGADDFVAKPYQQKVLIKRVATVMEEYETERKKYRKLLHLDVNSSFSFMDEFPFGYAIVDAGKHMNCVYMNQKCPIIFGYKDIKLIGVEKFGIFDGFEKKDSKEILATMGRGENYQSLCKVKDCNNKRKWIECKCQIIDENEKIYQVYFFDCTKEVEEKRSLQSAVEVLKLNSKCDSLTGIYHREYFYKKTKEYISNHQNEQIYMIVWNLDRFKVVNERYGRKTGDELLIRFSVILSETFRSIGTFCRLESDRFASCTTKEHMSKVYEGLAGYVENGMQGDMIHFPVMMHVGVYQIENNDMEIDLMIDRAMLALQSVKQSVVNRWGYYKDDMRSFLFTQQEIEQDMQNALVEEQFFIALQPIVEANTQKIISAEALIRWNHPEKGMIAPNYFIPVFEKNGFIGKLDLFVWKKVCELLAENEKMGIPNVPISVNLSRINFRRNDICEQYFEIVQEYQIDPKLLKIEITESAYTEDAENMISIVRKFHEYGFTVLMDDFGSGYSSLNMLKDVSVDVLKVDMKFMYNLETSEKGASILYSVINMAHSLNMSTIAEGVETKNQYEMLCELACDSVQGYYFSKPLKVDEFREKLQEKNDTMVALTKRELGTIMVVDDVQLMREIIKNAIGYEYQYLEAKNGMEALQLLKKNFLKVSLIITDVCMPQMDGISLLEAIQSNPNFNRIPVIVVTSYNEMGNVNKALEYGAMDVISKPFEPSILRKRIQNILRFRGHEMLNKELSILKEKNERSKFEEEFMSSDITAVICLELNQEEDSINVCYCNEFYKELHQIRSFEKISNPLFVNAVNRDLYLLNRYQTEILEQKPKHMQFVYSIKNKSGEEQKLLCNVSIRYENNMIEMKVVETEIFADQNCFSKDKAFLEMFENIVEGSGLEVYRYDISRNMMMYREKDSFGEVNVTEMLWDKENLKQREFEEEDFGRLLSITKRLTLGEKKVSEVFCCRRKYVGGKMINRQWWCRLAFTNIYNECGKPVYAIGIVEDVTQTVENENDEKMNERFREIMKRDTKFFAEIDLTENIFLSLDSQNNDEVMEIAQNSYDHFVDSLVLSHVYEDERKYAAGMLNRKQLIKWYSEGEREVNFEFRLMEDEQAKQYAWYSCKIYFYEHSENRHLDAILQLKNVHQEKIRINRILRLAEHDSLTGLLNRNAFENAVERNLEENQSSRKLSAFIMIDVDNFKTVNDSYGHEFGDEVLKTVASRIQGTFRREDYVGRMGGDEFAVYLPRIANEEIVENKVKILNKKIQKAFENCGKDIKVSCSIGVSVAPENGKTFNHLYKNADIAQYIAKKNGKSQYRIYNQLQDFEKIEKV